MQLSVHLERAYRLRSLLDSTPTSSNHHAMCGILFALSKSRHVEPDADLLRLLQQRGPDSTTTLIREARSAYNDSEEGVHLTFTSTVLSLRGDVVVQQPYSKEHDGSVLCWNGEAWSINSALVDGNDTPKIFELLETSSTDDEDEAVSLTRRLAMVAGPYAFVYFSRRTSRVYISRDFLGRRSLLWRATANGELLISSVSTGSANGVWNEVDADGLYCINLKQPSADGILRWGAFAVARQPYHLCEPGWSESQTRTSVLPLLSMNTSLVGAPLELLSEHSSVISVLLEQLTKSLRTRILDIPYPPAVLNQDLPCKLAILFSGGLDCTVLARLAHDLLPIHEPIDLLNVAFENPRIHKNVAQDEAYELCPDRITGRASFEELLRVCPNRTWRFVSVNVPYKETLDHRETIISLMYPHNTEMDLSISSALYFAARGSGLLSTKEGRDLPLHNTSARVLLSGLGADELFSGYTRHTTAYRRDGYKGLFEELNLDVGRLGKRNLGRDDRVISNWSKEVRFPYLDEAFVQWALKCHIMQKTGFDEDCAVVEVTDSSQLEPGKKALRCLAWKLGMTQVAKEKKRAIQFGARTAKMETSKTKGTSLLA